MTEAIRPTASGQRILLVVVVPSIQGTVDCMAVNIESLGHTSLLFAGRTGCSDGRPGGLRQLMANLTITRYFGTKLP